MLVRAKKIGYYDNKRRREGETFELKPLKGKFLKDGKLVDGVMSPEQLFSEKWMEKVVDDEPRKPKMKKQAVQEASYEDEEVI
jgi:hypothetical protein